MGVLLLPGLALVILALSYIWWPKDARSFRLVAFTALTLGSIIGLCILIANMLPVTRKETVIQEVVKKYKEPPKVVTKVKEVTVYKNPAEWLQPIDPEAVCKGSRPIRIISMIVNDPDTNNRRTYVTADVVGTGTNITCEVPGVFTDIWKEGMIITTARGTPQ
jgi:hypothetical protein